MSASSQPVLLYGIPFSQPVRAVMWLLLHKRVPFTLVPINPGSKSDHGSRSPAYLEKNPGGTIPTLEEPDTGFVLGEAHAILCYLANKHGWHDVYPADPRQRARVDWYLHYHHRNVREASIGLIAPKIRKDLNIPEAVQQTAQAIFTRALRTLESGWLAQSRFLAGAQPMLADFAAYVEIGQLQPGFTNVFDFTPFPNVRRWLDDMKQVDGHDDAHVVLTALGDISVEPPAMEAIKNANVRALGVVKQRVAEMAT
ncbi:MAG TPA: glutathione S-transferase family protein [Quisquiliibacterium sp.]|nr:glutathione S-transferase family protein [Quisquiliibacterium sp.]HQN14050.1 glutathione S-transferase family protein [Quisquiliibacterium sp.]HQP68567.1 glutathione S-transferase family protein [Quisquiliibacterium sp.]